jgi:RNA-directed DNA polymerase
MNSSRERNRRQCSPAGAKQAGDNPRETGTPAIATGLSRWNGVERSVWTDCMLDALERGVKGGKWFSLFDKVHDRKTLLAAYNRVATNNGAAGVDNVSVKRFGSNLECELNKLHEELRLRNYNPRPVKRVQIPKPGKKETRPLGIPTVRDRVVQTALRMVIEPIFEAEFAEHSYGFRPGKGCKDALGRVCELLKSDHNFVVDADIKSYFDSIPHDRLMARLEEKISDGQILSLLRSYMEAEILDDAKQWTPDQGTPQGAVISPLLANIYLNPLDHLMAQEGFEMIRYADDFVILCTTKEDAQEALGIVKGWMENEQLALHPEKTRLLEVTEKEGFDFLGYHFRKKGTLKRRWVTRKKEKLFREKLKPLTKRTNGNSMETIIKKINPMLRGWYEYFKHSHPNVLESIDGWVRGRLRGILRKRRKLRGRGRGEDHIRWKNDFFHALGLFSQLQAQRRELQSALR